VTELHVGITGSRHGISSSQLQSATESFTRWTQEGYRVVVHHGDCYGADVSVADVACRLALGIVCHPPDNDQHRAFFSAGEVRVAKPYLDRNHDIVDESHVLLAFPTGAQETTRSGTWATTRYASRRMRPECVWVIPPDGVPINYHDLKK